MAVTNSLRGTATKYWCRQNILIDKIIGVEQVSASTKLLASTKYTCRQNVGVDKISAWTKCWRRQNIRVNKVVASTTYQRRQNVGVDKILVVTKCWRRKKWCRHRRIPLLFGSAESAAAGFSRAAGPAEDLLGLPDGAALFACSRQVRHSLQLPCFNGRTLSCTVPAYCTGLPC
jgi:hypothetical protein